MPVSDDDTEDAGDDDLRDNECGDCVTITNTNTPNNSKVMKRVLTLAAMGYLAFHEQTRIKCYCQDSRTANKVNGLEYLEEL